jgi:serine/threonine protein kinase
MASSDSPVREGDLLAGKYRVERVLGEGGMGIVVAAVHEALHQRVAIKFVRDEVLDTPEVVARFLIEARAAAALKSEHAARVSDVGTLESGAPYMVMELLEGSDLNDVLEKRGTVSVEIAADWLIQACEAVAEAHAAGIVHRDLKPQNLFLARTVGGGTTIKVLDFGVSKSSFSGSLTSTGALLGSPLYMSPEQMRSSKDVSPRADVWALGVVFFQLLTGRMPFEAPSLPELCLKVASDPPQSIRELKADVPAEVLAIIERCLEKDPSRRYADASELATALEPLAPPASSVIAERARMAMTCAKPEPMPSPPVRETARTWKSVEAQSAASAAKTPSAWDSKRVTGEKRTGRAGLIAGAVGVTAAVVTAAALFVVWVPSRGAPSAVGATSPPSPSSSSGSSMALADPTSPAAVTPAPSASPMVAPPSAVVSATPSAVVAAPVAPSAAVAPVASSAASSHHRDVPRSNRPSAAPTADDIPAMR